MNHPLKKSCIAFVLITNSIGLTNFSQASDTSQIFHEAPAPEILSQLLFPPRYRGIDSQGLNNEGQTGMFGMMINFAFNSTEILPESEPMLGSVGEMMGLEAVSGKSIVVEGHTDAVGSDAYNQALSEKRAHAIKNYLVEHFGIAPKRLLAVGKGERDLYEKDSPEAPINRRAMFRPLQKVVLK